MSGPDDLAEWVGYLRDIGVRELSVPEAPPRKAAPGEQPTRPRAGAPTEQTPRRRGSAPAAPRAAADTSAVLGSPALPDGVEGFEGAPPPDPARRLEEIREQIGDCTRCKLHEQRENVVFGVGNPRAGLMFVGEGPGADEDAKGEPFVGRAGKKLDEMIQAIGLSREVVYIANIVKCRPPKNRDPEREEIDTCIPFLEAQIEAIRPKVIVTLGSPATKTLLGTKLGITRLRGDWHSYRGIPVMPTFHPAYLLRRYTVENRRTVWNDLKAARQRMDDAT